MPEVCLSVRESAPVCTGSALVCAGSTPVFPENKIRLSVPEMRVPEVTD